MQFSDMLLLTSPKSLVGQHRVKLHIPVKELLDRPRRNVSTDPKGKVLVIHFTNSSGPLSVMFEYAFGGAEIRNHSHKRRETKSEEKKKMLELCIDYDR